MAILHVNSASGSNTAPYETWAKACPTLLTALNAAAAGDTIYVDSAHDETIAGTTSNTSIGTQTAPLKVLSGTHSGASGLDALAAGARIQANAFTYTLSGSVYYYGMVFYMSGAGSGLWQINNATGHISMFENCAFRGEGSSTAQDWIFNGTSVSDTVCVMLNCTVKFGNAGQDWRCNGVMRMNGITVESGSTSPTTWLSLNGSSGFASIVEIDGADLSNWGTSFNVCDDSSTSDAAILTANGLKFPASWAGALLANAPCLTGTRVQMINYSIGTGDTNYKFWEEKRTGRSKDDTTLKLTTAPASDETTGYSIKVETLANCAFPHIIYRVRPIYKRVTSAGGTHDISVNIVHDGASAFTDQEVWVEIAYYGTSGAPIWTTVSDRCSPIASATAQTSSGVAWDGDTGTGPNGSSTWNQLKLHVTGLTLAENGYIKATVCVAVPSKFLYVDPQITVS